MEVRNKKQMRHCGEGIGRVNNTSPRNWFHVAVNDASLVGPALPYTALWIGRFRLRLLFPRAVKNRAGTRSVVLTPIQHDLAVHDHILHAGRILMRLLISGMVDDRSGIEYRDIGRHSGTQQTAIEL